MLLLRAHVLALGHSGVRPELVDLMVEMLNADVIPSVPEQGSLGASGDLAPLANLALPLIGAGEVLTDVGTEPAAGAMQRAGLAPLTLEAKEGLALVNGTQGMLAIGVLAAERLSTLLRTADVVAAMTIEAALGTDAPFDDRLQRLRPHPGQAASASNLRRLLDGIADPRLPPGQRASRAGRVLAPLRAAGPRRHARRARFRAGRPRDRAERGLGQPDRAARTTGTSCRGATSTASRSRSRWTRWRPRRWGWRASANAGSTGCSTPRSRTGSRRSSFPRAA